MIDFSILKGLIITSIEDLEEGSVANRLAFLDWLINELEKSKTIK